VIGFGRGALLITAAAFLAMAPAARTRQEEPSQKKTEKKEEKTQEAARPARDKAVPKLRGGRKASTDVAPPPPAAGQTLEDVVRAARRTRAKKASPNGKRVVISNETLKKYDKGHLTTVETPAAERSGADKAPRQAPTATAAQPQPAGKSATEKQEQEPRAAPEKSTGPVDDEGHGETWWRAELTTIRTRISEEERRQTTLEGEIGRLENDFYRWDDPAYRDNVIKPAWDKAKRDAEDNARELANDRKALADRLEHARKVGAWPGWLRE
jgi:hypothetical protein